MVNTRIDFLKSLNSKTVEYLPCSMTPNMSGKTVHGHHAKLKDYRISNDDFNKIIKIIKEELLLILPKTSVMGYIEGYYIIGLDGKTILLFGDSNIPKGITLKSIFPLCRTINNMDIRKELLKEGKISHHNLHKKYSDYCY